VSTLDLNTAPAVEELQRLLLDKGLVRLLAPQATLAREYLSEHFGAPASDSPEPGEGPDGPWLRHMRLAMEVATGRWGTDASGRHVLLPADRWTRELYFLWLACVLAFVHTAALPPGAFVVVADYATTSSTADGATSDCPTVEGLQAYILHELGDDPSYPAPLLRAWATSPEPELVCSLGDCFLTTDGRLVCDEGLSAGTMVGIGIAAVAVIGIGYLLLRKK
jgi:hypothetical protein